jgi:hypothetical protein
MEFNYDADKKPVILVSLKDFMCITHGALYAAGNVDYIKQFPVTSAQIVNASDGIDNTRSLIEDFIRKFNKEKSPDVPSQVE